MLQSTLQEFLHVLQQPTISTADYQRIDAILTRLREYRGDPEFSQALHALRAQFRSIGSSGTMQGMAYAKKHGYAGDFDIIDKIYTRWHSPEPDLLGWDEYFHQHHGPNAVRNRKTYFKDVLRELSTARSETIRVLNLSSGPCRDVLEFLQETRDTRFRFTCVELDPNAIAYAKSLLGPFTTSVEFVNKNVFKFIPAIAYNLVWCAGLFDHFDDRAFVRVLSRYANSERLIIGNFSDQNPSSSYMEVIGEWYLNYRSVDTLVQLGVDAGFDVRCIDVRSEPTGVNLFLHINTGC